MEYYVNNNQFIGDLPIPDLTGDQQTALIAGIVYGVTDKKIDFAEIERCLNDGDAYNVIKDFDADQWVNGIEEGNWTTGIEELGGIVKAIPSLMTDCGPEIATLETWAFNFLDKPEDLEALIRKNVPFKLMKLTSDLNQAKQAWDNEKYFDFGTKIGEMLVTSTKPLTAAPFLKRTFTKSRNFF